MKLLLALIYSLLSLITSGHQNRSEAIPGPLNDYRNRSFDPATGRFLQRDPVLDEHNLYNPYVGMGNNPVGNVDPMGTYMVARNGAAVAYVRRKMRSIGLKLEVAQVKGGYLLDVLTPNGYDREKIARARGKTWWGTSTRRILDRILDNNNNWTISGSGSMASADPSVLLAAVKGAAEGAVTGGKAVVNATASTVVGTVTCGAVDRVELIKYTQRDLDNGARLSEGLARAGTEILAGVATGSIVAKAGNLSKIGKVVRVMDLAQSGGDIVVGSADIAINGANVGNVMRVVGGVAGGTGELVGSLRGSRAAKNADVDEFVSSVPTKNTPTKTAANQFEIRHTGNRNYTVQGGGEALDIDGYRGTTILEAKHVGKPGRSPFVPGSAAPDFIRQGILDQVDDELRRMGKILDDPSNPFDAVEVITNDPRAAELFGEMMKARGLRPNVKVGS